MTGSYVGLLWCSYFWSLIPVGWGVLLLIGYVLLPILLRVAFDVLVDS